MADTKITALAAIATVDPAADVLPIVDISDTSMAASGTTKKVTSNQILGAGGTATLASATITGAATVGTTLGVTGASTLASVGVTGAATVGTTLGVTGVSTFAAGTALLPALTTTGDTNTGIYYPAADTFAVTTGGTERYRVDSAGNCGIGVTPSAWQTGLKALQFAANGVLYGNGTNGSFFGNNYYTNSSGDNKYILTNYATAYGQVSGAHQWYNAAIGTAGDTITFGDAKMTLDASGIFLIGLPTSVATNSGSFIFSPGTSSYGGVLSINHSTSNVNGSGFVNFNYNVTNIGSISQNGTTGVLYNIVSDYRLKESIVPISGGLARVNALKPSVYNWKSDGSTGEGFLAHELAEVVPFAVTGEKDAVDKDGKIKPQGIDMSRVVPILVAAIQELTAEVNALKNA